VPSAILELKTYAGRVRALEIAHARLERETDPVEIKCRAGKLRTLRESCRVISHDWERYEKNERDKERTKIERDCIEVDVEQNELARELLEQMKNTDKSNPFGDL